MSDKISKDNIIVDFQKILGNLLSYWWLFLICFGLAFGLGQLYLRYATFQYSARAILLIKDAGRSGNISEQSILLAEAGISGGGKSMDNEIQILKSLALMEKVVDRLNLNVQYYRIGKLKESELYHDSPFFLDSFQLIDYYKLGTSFELELQNYETFLLKPTGSEEEAISYKFNEPFVRPEGVFFITLNPREAIVPGQYRLDIVSTEYAARQYRSNFTAQRIGDQRASSVLDLSILDPVPAKASEIINTLIDVYNEEEVNDENTVLRNTLDFIDKRVEDLVEELDSVEGGIQRFKSANEIISENASSSMNYTLGEIRNSVQQISEFEIQKDLLQSLESFLTIEKMGYELIPTNLIAENPVLSGLVTQYNALVLQNKKMMFSASEKNPARIALENQIMDISNLILETIRNLKKDIQIPVAKIEDNIRELRKSMSSIPGIEKKLIEKMRTQAVKEKLFLFLLQKREETALSEAVTTAKTRTIDRARVSSFAVYPRRKFILASCAFLGLTVPLLLIFIISFFQTTIESEETIKQLTKIPILGRIAFQKGKEHIIVRQGNRSAVNEMFRLLRTNLNFLNSGKQQQTILITSSVSGEGKTFIALNLGITLALSNKKVILIGSDLRKPKLGAYLKHTSGVGLTNYLIGQNNLEEIVNIYEDNKNLSFIASGPLPPNPGELLLGDKMENLLKELAKEYDYVLVDTPPIGLVSDALLLRKCVDNILVVVRQNMTKKIMVKNLEALYEKGELEQAHIIFNGVKSGKRYYGYGGYYYGADKSGYYVEE